jgi:hypothetical protein
VPQHQPAEPPAAQHHPCGSKASHSINAIDPAPERKEEGALLQKIASDMHIESLHNNVYMCLQRCSAGRTPQATDVLCEWLGQHVNSPLHQVGVKT